MIVQNDPKNKSKGPQEKTVKIIDTFVEELLDMLVSDSKYVRESIMSLTGTGLSPTVYCILLSLFTCS
jgi:hypothetical protein